MTAPVNFSPAILDAIKEMTTPQLRELRVLLDGAITARHRDEIETARVEIQQIVRSVGEPLEVIMGTKVGTVQNKSVLPPMYRHPVTNKEWSGRGRSPGWFKEWVDGGKSADELRIP